MKQGLKTTTIVGARLNSSRLPGKHLLPLHDRPLIGRVVDRLRKISSIDQILLSTTADDFNKPLRDWATANGVALHAYTGPVDDLMGRIDEAVRISEADLVLYICGDCPLVEPATIERLVKALGSSPDSDLALLRPLPNGKEYIHEGFNLYSRSFWDQLVAHSTEPHEREHVGIVYSKLKRVMPRKIAYVDEDPVFSKLNHRISVDTQRDYEFMSEVYQRWYQVNNADTIVSLPWVIEQLESDLNLQSMNGHVRQKEVRDVSPRVVILCEAGPKKGLGHLTRATTAGAALQDQISANVKLVIRGDPIDHEMLKGFEVSWIKSLAASEVDFDKTNIVVVDTAELDDEVADLISDLGSEVLKVGIDIEPKDSRFFDLIWMPCLFIPVEKQPLYGEHMKFGADCFLLPKAPLWNRSKNLNRANRRVIVLTGGSDPTGLSTTLPPILEAALDPKIEIHWIKGPYAQPPIIEQSFQQKRWIVWDSPTNLPKILCDYDAALCVYGVSFYECAQAGLPTVTFDPVGAATPEEWQHLREKAPAYVAKDPTDAVKIIASMLLNSYRHTVDSDLRKVLSSGPANFASFVGDHIKDR